MSNRYTDELDYLSDVVTDMLVDVNWMIELQGPCDTFESRMVPGSERCRHCAFTKAKH